MLYKALANIPATAGAEKRTSSVDKDLSLNGLFGFDIILFFTRTTIYFIKNAVFGLPLVFLRFFL